MDRVHAGFIQHVLSITVLSPTLCLLFSAFPVDQDLSNVITVHPVASRSEARLPCAIQPGKLVDLYIVQWSKVSGERIIEFRSGMPLTNLDPKRYRVDSTDLSLRIADVVPADGGDYRCVLSVRGPDRADAEMFYEQTRYVNITLVVFGMYKYLPVIAKV